MGLETSLTTRTCFAVVIAAFALQAKSENEAESRSSRSATLDRVVVEGQRERSTVALDDVVATGSRLDVEVKDLPASVSVLTQEAIQLQGVRTALEAIGSVVGMTGGVSVGSIPSFSTRGFTSNDITIMRDGIRQNTGSQSSRPLDAFLFERVEVLKGPASLLFGEGAIGGAINYVSKVPTDMFTAEGFASVGSWETLRYGAGAGGPTGIENLSFRFDASRSTSDGYVDGSDYEYSAFAGALRWDASIDTCITLSSTYLKDFTHSYYGTPVVYDAVINRVTGVRSVARANALTDELINARIVPGTERLNYNNIFNFARAENSFNRVIVDTALGGDWSLRSELYVATQRFAWRNIESTLWNPVTRLVERGSFFLIYRNDEQLGNRSDLIWDGELFGRKNQFLFGALYDHNDMVRNSNQVLSVAARNLAPIPLVGFANEYGPADVAQPTLRYDIDTKAAYVENLFEPLDSLKLMAGLRFDRIDIERRSYVNGTTYVKQYEPVTGRVGAVYAVRDNINTYISYTRAAQPVVQLVSLSVDQNDFSLQKGQQYEVGVKASIASSAELTVALFDIEKNDLLTSVDLGARRVPSQIGAQVSRGAELALAFAPTGDWRIDANLAWTWKAEYEDFNENFGAGVISRNGNTPPNVAKVVANVFAMKEVGNWVGTLGVRHVGERQANNNNGIQMDAYTTLNASVGYRWDSLHITLRGRNLTDEQYAEWAVQSGLMQRLADPISTELELRYKF